MQPVNSSGVIMESTVFESKYLERKVTIDFFIPEDVKDPSTMSLLLINDGQNLQELGMISVLSELYRVKAIRPIFCAGIYSGKERKMEYGVAAEADYMGRGLNAGLYTAFIIY